jgi:hypothetical protein
VKCYFHVDVTTKKRVSLDFYCTHHMNHRPGSTDAPPPVSDAIRPMKCTHTQYQNVRTLLDSGGVLQNFCVVREGQHQELAFALYWGVGVCGWVDGWVSECGCGWVGVDVGGCGCGCGEGWGREEGRQATMGLGGVALGESWSQDRTINP